MKSTASPELCLGKFVFLIHPTSLDDLYLSGPPAFDRFAPEERAGWQDWIKSWSARHYEPGIAYHLPAMHSKAGGYAEGWLVCIPLTPEQMMRLRPAERTQLMAACVDLAKNLGADILGLGAFTSIITRNGADLDACGMHVTTGNSLTAMVAAESIKLAAGAKGRRLHHAAVGIVGAAGSVGRLAAHHLAEECANLTFFGNPANPNAITRLEELAGEIYQAAARRVLDGTAVGGVAGRLLLVEDWLTTLPDDLLEPKPSAHRAMYTAVRNRLYQKTEPLPIALSVHPDSDLPRIEFLITATSAGKSVIDVDLLRKGAVVCDVARPADVCTRLSGARSDLTVYEGGLLRLPEPVRFGRRNVIGCEAGVNLACLSETITLALSGARRSYSVGSAPPIDDAREVLHLARHHGFDIMTPAIGKGGTQ